jgi:hypothetical protein
MIRKSGFFQQQDSPHPDRPHGDGFGRVLRFLNLCKVLDSASIRELAAALRRRPGGLAALLPLLDTDGERQLFTAQQPESFVSEGVDPA